MGPGHPGRGARCCRFRRWWRSRRWFFSCGMYTASRRRRRSAAPTAARRPTLVTCRPAVEGRRRRPSASRPLPRFRWSRHGLGREPAEVEAEAAVRSTLVRGVGPAVPVEEGQPVFHRVRVARASDADLSTAIDDAHRQCDGPAARRVAERVVEHVLDDAAAKSGAVAISSSSVAMRHPRASRASSNIATSVGVAFAGKQPGTSLRFARTTAAGFLGSWTTRAVISYSSCCGATRRS